MWDSFIVNVDNEFKNLDYKLAPGVSFTLVLNFWPETFGTEKKRLAQEGTEGHGATSGSQKGCPRLGYPQAQVSRLDLLEDPQGASVQWEPLNLDFTPGKGSSISAGSRESWVKLQENKTLQFIFTWAC